MKRVLLIGVLFAALFSTATTSASAYYVTANDARSASTAYVLLDIQSGWALSASIGTCAGGTTRGWCNVTEGGIDWNNDGDRGWSVNHTLDVEDDGRCYTRVKSRLFDEPWLRVKRPGPPPGC